MQSQKRIDKLKEAQRLLNNEPEPRAPKCWLLMTENGITTYPEGFEDFQDDIDIAFDIVIVEPKTID
jgi:hypothetical protein